MFTQRRAAISQTIMNVGVATGADPYLALKHGSTNEPPDSDKFMMLLNIGVRKGNLC